MQLQRIFGSLVVVIAFSGVVFAAQHTQEERGRALFNDATLGGGATGRSCATCHPKGDGLEGVGSQKEWNTPGGTAKSLEEAVNHCIMAALKGRALDVRSQKMKDLVSYLRSLKLKSGGVSRR